MKINREIVEAVYNIEGLTKEEFDLLKYGLDMICLDEDRHLFPRWGQSEQAITARSMLNQLRKEE